MFSFDDGVAFSSNARIFFFFFGGGRDSTNQTQTNHSPRALFFFLLFSGDQIAKLQIPLSFRETAKVGRTAMSIFMQNRSSDGNIAIV